MESKKNRNSSPTESGVSDSLFITGVFVLIILLWIGTSFSFKNNDQRFSKAPSVPPYGNFSSVNTISETPSAAAISNNVSPWKGKITISQGNAQYEFQPSKEYITIQNSVYGESLDSAAISGWVLENGRGQKSYQVGGNVVSGRSSRVKIPLVGKFYTTSPLFVEPIVLRPGEMLIVTTGYPPAGIVRTSGFKTNKCMGYLEDEFDTFFSPQMIRLCPSARSYSFTMRSDRDCYNFLNNMSQCHAPEFKDVREQDGSFEIGAPDRVLGLSNECKLFIRQNLNYNSCILNHSADADFYQREWRVFLNQPFELWENEREQITLYDNLGRTVDQIKY